MDDVDIAENSVIDFIIEKYNDSSDNANYEEDTADSVDSDAVDSINSDNKASKE